MILYLDKNVLFESFQVDLDKLSFGKRKLAIGESKLIKTGINLKEFLICLKIQESLWINRKKQNREQEIYRFSRWKDFHRPNIHLSGEPERHRGRLLGLEHSGHSLLSGRSGANSLSRPSSGSLRRCWMHFCCYTDRRTVQMVPTWDYCHILKQEANFIRIRFHFNRAQKQLKLSNHNKCIVHV